MTLIFTPNVSKRLQVSLVLISSVLQTQHTYKPTATDGKVDDSSLENLDVCIIEIQTSQTDPRRLLITDCGAQFISLGPRTVGVCAGSPRSISAGWMWIHSHHHHCHHCSTSARSEWSFIGERSLSGQSQSWHSFGRCVHWSDPGSPLVRFKVQ